MGFLLCLGSTGKFLKVMLFPVRLSLWRRQAPGINQGQVLVPILLARAQYGVPPHLGNCLTPFFSLFDPSEVVSGPHALRQGLLGRGQVHLSLVYPVCLLFSSFCVFGYSLFILRHFSVSSSFYLLPSKTRLFGKSSDKHICTEV